MSHARDEPAPPGAFHLRVMVEAADVDALGHANNVAYLRWLQDAATGHSVSLGLDLAAYQARGHLWVVRRHDIEYLVSAQPGEALVITTWIAGHRGATAQRRTQVRREGDGVLLCRAETTWVLVQWPSGRPTRVPLDLVALYQAPRA